MNWLLKLVALFCASFGRYERWGNCNRPERRYNGVARRTINLVFRSAALFHRVGAAFYFVESWPGWLLVSGGLVVRRIKTPVLSARVPLNPVTRADAIFQSLLLKEKWVDPLV